jgi:hypothetical protein
MMGFHEKERTVWEKGRKEQTNKGGRWEAHTMSLVLGRSYPTLRWGQVKWPRFNVGERIPSCLPTLFPSLTREVASMAYGIQSRCVTCCVLRRALRMETKWQVRSSLVPANVEVPTSSICTLYGVSLHTFIFLPNTGSPILDTDFGPGHDQQWQAIIIHTHAVQVLMTTTLVANPCSNVFWSTITKLLGSCRHTKNAPLRETIRE